MKRYTCQTFLTFLIGLAGIGAFARDDRLYVRVEAALDQDVTTDVVPLLQKLDNDKDGYIDRHESEQLEGLGAVFDVVDENHDDRIDTTELSKYLTPRVH